MKQYLVKISLLRNGRYFLLEFGLILCPRLMEGRKADQDRLQIDRISSYHRAERFGAPINTRLDCPSGLLAYR